MNKMKSMDRLIRISKNVFFPMLILSVLGGCQQNNSQGQASAESTAVSDQAIGIEDEGREHGNDAVMTFESDSFSFGVVSEGTKVDHEFVFTNNGTEPLIIHQVSASCGCTTPEYSRKPVGPGEQGSVRVIFDSEGQPGLQHKIITIGSNSKDGVSLLHLRGEVQ